MAPENQMNARDRSEHLTITVNAHSMDVVPGTSVAAAMLAANTYCRISITGTPRAPLCGMGICFECRAIVNGIPHQRTCQIFCTEGMVVETQR